ncbi:adenosine receptor A1-like [Littorina saxatilis]|uniref:G-protein coupled receptors family 1 profile domain-containing protein n=1 Tax=Littorina saxatilis TaxID=31220 RepID=A0AAN9BZ39_9CAEN
MTHTAYQFNITSSHVTNYFVTWAATVPMVTVSVVALAANGTVLVMFAIRPSLRRGKNAYIASLALADFLIGCYMPLVALEEVGLVTVEPGPLCKTYLTVRYSLLYVSLLSVVFITLDRWWSVRWPFSYRARHTRRLAAYVISGVWALSVVLYALPMFLWEDPYRHLTRLLVQANHPEYKANDNGDSSHPSDVIQQHHHDVMGWCEVPYALSFTWAAVTCCLMYLLPLVAMWIINCSLYHKIRQRRSVEIRRSESVTDTFFVTVKNSKPTIQITEAPSLVGPPSCSELCSLLGDFVVVGVVVGVGVVVVVGGVGGGGGGGGGGGPRDPHIRYLNRLM